MTQGIPPPTWPAVNDDKKVTEPWYRYLFDADAAWRVKLTYVTSGTTANTIITNNGITLIQTTPGTTSTLSLPTPGCRKVLVMQTSSNTGRVALPSTTAQFLPGTGWALTFSTTLPNKLIELVGVSTSQYYIVSNPGSVTVTT